MMDQIVSISLIDAPDRMRACDKFMIAVQVDLKSGKSYSGIALTSSETEEEMNAAIMRAAKAAIEQNQLSLGVPNEVVKKCAELGGQKALELTQHTDHDNYEDMKAKCTDKQQKKMDEICEELDLAVIDVSDMNLASFYCLQKALTEQITRGK